MVFGPGDAITVTAAPAQPEDSPNLEVLVLGGLPIREPIAHHGRSHEHRQGSSTPWRTTRPPAWHIPVRTERAITQP